MKYPIRHEKNNQRSFLLGDGKVALGVIFGVAATIFVILLLDFRQDSGTDSSLIEFTPIIVSLLVGVASIFLASSALLEQRKTREASTDPVLIVHLGQREDERGLVTFNISNVGAGAALNVKLSVDKPTDTIENRNLIKEVFGDFHPFTVILQGKSVQFNFAMGWELLGEKPLPPFKAKLSYDDLVGFGYESEFLVDVRELKGISAHQTPEIRMVKALEKIAKQKKN